MKVSKKILGTILSIGAIGAAIGTSTYFLSSCSSSTSIGQVYKTVADPYKELNMFATTLDKAGYVNEPSKSFTQLSSEVSTKVKNYIKSIATLLEQKKLNNKSVMFLHNTKIESFSNSLDNAKKLQILNNFQSEQPILYPTIYSHKDNQEVPGLGLSFPEPKNKEGWRLFDDWFEIGASALDSGNTSIPGMIADDWAGTCDFVFYLYDSKNLTPEQETQLQNYILSSPSGFFGSKMLKSDAPIKKVIPLDQEYFYNTTFHVLGQQFLAEWIASVLIDAQDGTWTTLTESPEVKALEVQKQAISTITTMAQTKLTNRLPNITNSKLVNFASLKDNVNGHLAALGIKPEIFTFNAEFPKKAKQHQYLGAFFEDVDPTSAKGTTIFTNVNEGNSVEQKFFSRGQSESIQSKNVYAIASDRSSFGNLGVWPLTSSKQQRSLEIKNQKFEFNNVTNISQRNSTAYDYEGLINQGWVGTCVYTERNDTSFTQSTYTLKILKTDGTLVNLETYYKNTKGISDYCVLV